MAVIYTQTWYDELKNMINSCEHFAEKAPAQSLAMALEIVPDGKSPYISAGGELYYLLVLDHGKVTELAPLAARHDGRGLQFRFTANASVWEGIAAGQLDPITEGLRGAIRVRGDMRVLMRHAEAVKELVDLYGAQVSTEWPKGRPPY